MPRQRFIVAILAGLAIVLASPHAPCADKPNIVFILADDLGYGDVGCYGQKRIQTPHIDALAAQGMRFTQCYAGATVCAPSRCALMTGLHTGHCRIRGNAKVSLAADDTTLAALLKRNGYTTGMFGKWGLGNEDTPGAPSKQGWDESFGYLDQTHAHNYYTDHLFRLEERVDLEQNAGGKRVTYSHDLIANEALNFIDRHKDKPFFLYVPFTIPHGNNERLKAEGIGAEVPSDEPYSKEEWPQAQKNFAAMVTRLDRDVGRIMEKLKALGLDEKTLVVFSSDNGPHKEGNDPAFFDSSGGLRGIKRDLYDGGIRVPFVVRWPGHIKAGATSSQIVAFWDMLPTFCELAGCETPKGLDGISIVPALLEGKALTHPPLYWEFHERGFEQAMRLDNWKAVRRGPTEPIELYDIENDRAEKSNVADQIPEVVKKFEALLAGARTESKDFPIRPKKKTN